MFACASGLPEEAKLIAKTGYWAASLVNGRTVVGVGSNRKQYERALGIAKLLASTVKDDHYGLTFKGAPPTEVEPPEALHRNTSIINPQACIEASTAYKRVLLHIVKHSSLNNLAQHIQATLHTLVVFCVIYSSLWRGRL